jgi:hypothetical protein
MDRAQRLYEMLMKFFAEEQKAMRLNPAQLPTLGYVIGAEEDKSEDSAKESMAPPGRISDDDKRGAYRALIEEIAEEGPVKRGDEAIIEFIIMGEK